MRIKTREALRNIKKVDRAEILAQKTKGGVSSLYNSAEQTQNVGYESETDYAGSELQDKEERIARTIVMGADRVGRWGVRETCKNIYNWRNRQIKPKQNFKLKQLSAPQRPMLEAPKKGVKRAFKGTKTATKGVKTMANATVKGTKVASKATVKAAQLIKRAAIATANFIKVAVKAIVATAKAVVASLKGIIAAIVAGGWFATLIIVIIVLICAVIGSVYAIFTPAEDNGITIYEVMLNLENEHREQQAIIIENCQYDVLNYEGSMADWDDVIAVYAVKLNLGDDAQEVATFDESKAEELRRIFWSMNSIHLETETVTSYVPKQEIDENGNIVETTEEVMLVYLTIVSDSIDAFQAADDYGFNAKQDDMLAELLSEKNEDMWAGLLI